MQQNPFQEANQVTARQEIPAFNGTNICITAFTRTNHLSEARPRSILSTVYIPLPKDPS